MTSTLDKKMIGKRLSLFKGVEADLKSKGFNASTVTNGADGLTEIILENIHPQDLPNPVMLREMFFDNGVKDDLTMKEYSEIKPIEFIPKDIGRGRFHIR